MGWVKTVVFSLVVGISLPAFATQTGAGDFGYVEKDGGWSDPITGDPVKLFCFCYFPQAGVAIDIGEQYIDDTGLECSVRGVSGTVICVPSPF